MFSPLHSCVYIIRLRPKLGLGSGGMYRAGSKNIHAWVSTAICLTRVGYRWVCGV